MHPTAVSACQARGQVRTAGWAAASIDPMAATSPETYLADLNPAQREAVLATEGPLLVIAGAGSGKTRVLTYRVGHLLRAVGAKPPEILAITFTNKAANEMKERLERLIGPPARALWVMTFHAACGRIFRREAERLGYRSNFTIYDSQDQQRLVKSCLEELDKDPKRFVPRGIHAQISNLKNQLVLPSDALERVSSFYDQTVAEVYDLYQRRLHSSIALEQNYRSTNHILRAANGVISNNRERKPKELFSDLGDGDPVRVLEVEDEQAEARFVASEIAQLIGEGYSGREIAVFYRMNAQSRAVEQVLRMNDVAYQVIGGPRFYERAEIKDATAYLQVIDNPADAVSLARIANRPRRGIGDTTLGRLQAWADVNAATLFEALGNGEAAGITGASLRAVQGFHTLMHSLMSAAQELDVADLLQAVYDRSGMLEALEAERTIEARGRIENLESFVDGARESQSETLSGFLQEISLYSDQDAIAEESGAVTLMTLHNAKGLEFRAVFLVGCEEEIFPSSRSIEEQGVEEERRLFYVGLTRAKERLTLTHASARLLWGRTTHNLPSRFLDELPEREIEREALRPTSWAAYGRPAASIAPRAEQPSLSTGDSVRHGTLGEGVVTRIEPGGVVPVRFAADGTERRLMLDYAPLEKIA